LVAANIFWEWKKVEVADLPRVCALIPAYNAASTLAPVIQGVKKHVETVIVVDDGSDDNTMRVAQEQGARTLRHELNKGKGEALKLGFEQASELGFEAVVTVDADGQHDPHEIPRLIEAYSAAGRGTIVLGSRLEQMPKMRRIRQISNRVGTALISRLAKCPIQDSQTGFRLIPVAVWNELQVQGSRFDAEAEFLIRACRSGYPLREVSVTSGFPDGTPTSHYRNVIDTFSIARGILAAWFRSVRRCPTSRGNAEQRKRGQES
jgi:glycosyltransferase involved in cell wall biosynthesis